MGKYTSPVDTMGWKNGWKSPFLHPRWWFELEKYAQVKLDHETPNIRGEKKEMFELPPPSGEIHSRKLSSRKRSHILPNEKFRKSSTQKGLAGKGSF